MDEQEGNPLSESGEMVPQTTAQMTPELRKRRSTRIVQAVPLVVTGVDALGRPFQERTSTLIINCHGCRYQSKHYVLKNMWVSLEIPHPESGQAPRSVRGRVAWIQRPRTVRQLFQVAIELEVSGNAWGIAFPPDDWFAFPDSSAAAIPMPTPPEAITLSAPDMEVAPSMAEQPLETQTETVHVLPAVTSTDASLQLARQVTRLLAEAKQQIQTAAREAAVQAVAAEVRPAMKEWDARFIAAREELSAQVARSIETFQSEADLRARAAQAAAAETPQQELPKWLAPQLEQLTRELTERLLRDAAAHRAAHEELVHSANEALSGAKRAAEEAAERLHVAASQHEALLNAKAEAAGRALEETTRQQEEAVGAAQESLTRAADERRQQIAAAFAEAESNWKETLEANVKAGEDQLRAALGSKLAAASEQGVQALNELASTSHAQLGEETGRQMEALREAAAASNREAAAQFASFREGLNTEVGRAQEILSAVADSTARLEQFSSRLEEIQRGALESFRSHLEALANLHGEELQRRSGSLAEDLDARVRPAFEASCRDAVARFEAQIQAAVQPHISRADEAVQRLAGGRALLDAAVTMQKEKIHVTAEEAFQQAAERFRGRLDALQRELHEAAQAMVARDLAELDSRTSELKHAAIEDLFKSSEWYEKKAQTQLQHLVERGVEQADLQLRERAGEISRVFTGQLDGYSRNFVEHAQGQMEELVRESFDRARALFAEASETTSAAFTDEIQRHAREELDGFGEELRRSMDDSRAQADALRRELGAQMTAEQEAFLRRFQAAMTTAVESGVNDAQKQVRAELEPVLESWRSMAEEHQMRLRELYQKITDHWVEQYRARLENVSNSWIVATVSTLDRQSRDVLAVVAQATEEKMRETFAQVLAGVGEALRARLQEIASAFPSTNAKAAGSSR